MTVAGIPASNARREIFIDDMLPLIVEVKEISRMQASTAAFQSSRSGSPSSGHRHISEQFIGDISAEEEVFTVGIPKDALPIVLSHASIHG
jgi:hypothetical protein